MSGHKALPALNDLVLLAEGSVFGVSTHTEHATGKGNCKQADEQALMVDMTPCNTVYHHA